MKNFEVLDRPKFRCAAGCGELVDEGFCSDECARATGCQCWVCLHPPKVIRRKVRKVVVKKVTKPFYY
jgi:hypothetical protein